MLNDTVVLNIFIRVLHSIFICAPVRTKLITHVPPVLYDFFMRNAIQYPLSYVLKFSKYLYNVLLLHSMQFVVKCFMETDKLFK